MIFVPVKKLDENAIVPTYAHDGDAGADLYSNENITIMPNGGFNLVGTGISLAIPEGYVGLVHPRSGLAARQGVTVLNAPGTVDSGYRGEIKVNLINHSFLPVDIRKGYRIAQIVFQAYERGQFVVTADLDKTIRNENGHGSTGGFDG